MSDAQRLSRRIGNTSIIIEALDARFVKESTVVIINLQGVSHQIPEHFSEVVMKAVRAVLIQGRAVDAIHLAQAAGVPAVAEGMADDLSVVILAPRALVGPDKESEGD